MNRDGFGFQTSSVLFYLTRLTLQILNYFEDCEHRRNNDSVNIQSFENGENLQEWKERVLRQETKQEEGH